MLLPGCSDARSARPDGPLVRSDEAGIACVPATVGQDITYGLEVLQNSGQEQLKIEDVQLLGPSHLDLRAAYLLPIENLTTVGLLLGTPEQNAAASPWSRKQAASDAVIDGDEALNLVLWLRRTTGGDEARFQAIRVTYSQGDELFAWISSTTFLAREDCGLAGA